MITFTEADVEQAALDWLAAIGWQVAHGPDVAPDTPGAERDDYGQIVLARRLRDALARLNPSLPAAALDDAFRKLTNPEGATLEARNRSFHRMLVNGVTVEYRTNDGAIRGEQTLIIDFDNPDNNDWLAVKPVHRHREPEYPPPRCRPVPQRLAPGGHRVEEPRRRGRHHLDRLAATPDLPGRIARPVLHERGAHGFRRPERPHRHPRRGKGVVQALAHHFRGVTGGTPT